MVVALAALLWTGAGVIWWRGRAASAADLAGGAAIRPELAGAVGVNLEAGELTQPDLDATLAGLATDGIGWVRFTIAWDQAEPARGQFDWAAWDRIFAALARHPDLQPLVVLNGSPAWARAPADADNPLAPPHERADFGAYAAAVARRYGAQVRYYQVWHEPNIAPHWGAAPADPAGYTGLLREGAVQLRAADPDSQILLAALAPTTETGGANQSDVSYLDALYTAGAAAWFDVVAAEPYGFSQGVSAPANAGALNFARVTLLRQVMLRHGDASTPIWATAFGWNALPAGWAGQPSSWGQVTEDAQARNAAEAVKLSATRWPWLGSLFWAANCSPRPADDPWRGFALCAADGSHRPVRQALAAAAQTPVILPPGDHAADHPALHYDPGWRVTPQAADPSADDDVLTFTFYGVELSLRVQGGAYWAYYRISVDGEPANALPRDESGAAYLVLHDPLAETRIVTVATGLSPGQHEARLEAVGGWGQWALRGVLVSAERPEGRPWLPWGLAALALLASALCVILAWPWRRSGTLQRWHVGTLARWRATALPGGVLWTAAISLALVFAGSRWLPLDLAALAGLGLLFLIRPALALPLIAAAIPFWPAPKLLAGWSFSVYELFIWVAVGMRIADCVLRVACCVLRVPCCVLRVPCHGLRTTHHAPRTTHHAPRLASLDWPVLALLASGLLATLAAERYGVALREFRMVFLDGALFYWLITRVPRRFERTQMNTEERRGDEGFSPWPLVNGLLAGMVVVSALGLWQLATGQGRIDVEGVWRVRALYGSPNNLALVLDRVAPLALALAAFGVATRAGENSRGGSHAGRDATGHDNGPRIYAERRGFFPFIRVHPRSSAAISRAVLLSFAALLTAVACLATFSKGALLLGLPAGIGAVLLGGAWRTRRRWPLWALAGLAVAGLVVLLVLFRTPRFADLLNFQTGTSFFRVRLWQAAWQMGLDHPWLGVGPDNFLYAYRTHYVLPSAWQELNLSHPHNLLLDLWTRLGVIGVLAGGWALVAAFRRGWRLFRSGDSATWPLALGLLAGLAATVAHGLIDNSLFLVDLMALFMLTTGVLQRLDPERTA
ncbi:MAG: O-antigen ligase family protein [Chloroflexi bacterium]|nr:O-antigen ligase family protein [Chloroflexota bacterium]